MKPSGARHAGSHNLLERDFTATVPNTKWVTVIPYIRTAEHWLYLCVMVDLYSEPVVGWSMSPRQDRQLVMHAVLMAVWHRPGRIPVIRYFDRGCQFISEEYRRFLEAYQLTCSMSAVGSCADHAAAESFFGVLKRERVNRRHYRTRVEARADIIDCIERYHNPRQRRRLEWQQQGLARQAHAVGGPAKNILRSRPPSGNGRLVAEYLSGQLHAGLLLGAV